MRAQARRVAHEAEEESVFISMTDMTVGFLFIIMILMVFFASQVQTGDVVDRSLYMAAIKERDEWQETAEARQARIASLEAEVADLRNQLHAARAKIAVLERKLHELQQVLAERDRRITELEEENERLRVLVADLQKRVEDLEERLRKLDVIDPLEVYLSRVSATRRDILLKLRAAILTDFPELKVELSEESDALRFQGEGLFRTGSFSLAADKRQIVDRVAQRLDEILPCFTTGPSSRFGTACNPGFVMIEAIQIEGHTDNVGGERSNRTLSANRANETFFAMTGAAPELSSHLNLRRQPVLSVAAYGFDRPVASNNTPEGRATNRRIDLRFIMVTPSDTSGIRMIRDQLLSEEPREP